MYSFNSRVRYSEVNKDKELDLTSIINYFQDCSTFQSEDIGKGLAYLEQAKHIWLMNSWQIMINRFPSIGEYITIGTWSYGIKSMYGYRNFVIHDSKGQVCAAANSVWVLVDSTTHHPVKVTEEDISGYCTGEKYDMPYAPRKIEVPSDLTTQKEFTVIKANIDTNNHVNNGQYIRMAEEYLPSTFKTKQMRAEYRLSAILGDTIIPKLSLTDTLCTVILTSPNNSPYAVVSFES